jgi:inorganic triphosphatase YgiF
VETEAKYSLATEEVPQAEELDAAFAAVGLTVGPVRTVVHKDRYYDDARLSLARSGYAVRRRMAEGELLATLKTLGVVQGAVHRREEIELPIPATADAWDPWPEPIAERIRTVTDPRGLRGTFELVIERTSFEIREGDRRVAVASFDAVAARKPQGERSAHWNELEVEIADEAGDPAALLDRAADALGRLLPLVPSQQTKLERAQAVLLLGAALDPDGEGA